MLIGTGGILPPTETIDDDGLTSFDIATDGIDFWESLEGMRVTIDAPLVVSNTSEFGETDIVASLGAGATGVNERGGITISPGDYNPEKIQLDDRFGGAHRLRPRPQHRRPARQRHRHHQLQLRTLRTARHRARSRPRST